ncbi:MAG: transcription elongation factor GreA [Planctomycetota bacterium]
MTSNDLVHLARSLQFPAFEAAWSAAVQAPRTEDALRYANAIDALCERDMASKAVSYAMPMVEALAGKNMVDEAIEVAQRLLRRGAHNEALTHKMGALFHSRFSDEPWYPMVAQRSGLAAAPTSTALQEFDRMRRYTKGHVVYHQAGWGEGVVEEFHADRSEVTVRFANGRREDFPLDTVVQRFKSLPADDLRAMKLLSLAELQRLAAEDPSALIRITAKLYRGTINSAQVKQELSPSVIADKEWTSFWKRAKNAAAKDPWLRVEGSSTRPTFVMRAKPVGLAEEAETNLRHEAKLGAKIGVLRKYLERVQDDESRNQLFDLAARVVETALAEKKDSHAHMLDGLLFLTEHGRPTPVPPAHELRALLMGAEGAFHPKAIDNLQTIESRTHAVQLLPEAMGEHWADRCIADLTEFPVSVMEATFQKLVDSGHGARMLDLWDRVAPYPKRHQMLCYLLCRAYADGLFESREDKPTPVTVGRVMMHLARVLNEVRKGDSVSNRLLGRLTSVLAGKRGFLQRAFDGISREDLASYLGISERGGEDFPQEIVDILLRKIADSYPDLTAKADKPFWEREEFIFTSAEGMRRIKDEYNVLVGEKIPANSKAIGAAAALGDLSENSEWESAMEEQRNLTSRATEMDKQIRSARLVEDQEIPDGIVAPGTRVTLLEEESGKQRIYVILGPWDATEESTINYRAPIAHGILGLSVGETGELPSPGGPIAVRIERVERAI